MSLAVAPSPTVLLLAVVPGVDDHVEAVPASEAARAPKTPSWQGLVGIMEDDAVLSGGAESALTEMSDAELISMVTLDLASAVER